MPVFGARGRAGKSSREHAKSREQRAEQAKNQAEVKQAVNEVQQIADTLKQSKQTAKTDNSYGEEVKTVKFPPLVYVQNHIPKETNYGSSEFTTGDYVVIYASFAILVLIDILWNKIKGRKKNNNTDQNGKSGCEYNSETIKSGKKATLISNIIFFIVTFIIMILCILVAIKEVLLILFR